MTQTLRIISGRILKDTAILFFLVSFVFLFKEQELELTYLTIKYSTRTALLLAISSFLLYSAISSHIYKILILFRRLDTEIKLNFDVPAPVDNPQELVYKSSHLISFSVSDNFITDFIILGPKRFPRMERVLLLQIAYTVFFALFFIYNINFIAVQVLSSLTDLYQTIFTAVIDLTITLAVVAYFLVIYRLYFFERSIIIGKSNLTKELYFRLYSTHRLFATALEIEQQPSNSRPMSVDEDRIKKSLSDLQPILEKYSQLKNDQVFSSRIRKYHDRNFLINITDDENHQEELIKLIAQLTHLIPQNYILHIAESFVELFKASHRTSSLPNGMVLQEDLYDYFRELHDLTRRGTKTNDLSILKWDQSMRPDQPFPFVQRAIHKMIGAK